MKYYILQYYIVQYYIVLLVMIGLSLFPCNVFSEDQINSISSVWLQKVSSVNREVPLRSFLKLAAPNWGFSFFIDRRIDPEMPISCEFQSTILLDGIRQMTTDASLDFYLLDTVLYIGPSGSAAELQYLLKMNRNHLQNGERRLSTALKEKTTISNAFAESPEILLRRIADRVPFTWSNPKLLPVDCWNENSLNDIALCDCLTMILFGFGLRYEPAETGIVLRIVPIENDLAEQAAVETNSIQNSYKQVLKTTVKEKKSNTSEKKVVSGAVNNTLGTLFLFLENELNVQFVLDPSLADRNITLETRVVCNFKKASVEKVATQLATQLNIRYRIENRKILFY